VQVALLASPSASRMVVLALRLILLVRLIRLSRLLRVSPTGYLAHDRKDAVSYFTSRLLNGTTQRPECRLHRPNEAPPGASHSSFGPIEPSCMFPWKSPLSCPWSSVIGAHMIDTQ
jgi:hypothetical protein